MTPPVLLSILGLIATIITIILPRIVTRRVRVRVHRASFADGNIYGPDCYFVNVTNVSLNREVEVTHVWFECSPEVHALRSERPLPKRLKVDETWATWVRVGELPAGVTDEDVYKLARVRLSTGKVFRSKKNEHVPSVG